MSNLHVLNPGTHQNEFEANQAPTSPFLSEPAYALSDARGAAPAADGQGDSIQSPFVSEFSLGSDSYESHETTLLREIMLGLHDADFEDALEDLANDVRNTYELRLEGETSLSPEQAEREMTRYLAPVREELEGAIDHMIAEAEAVDDNAMSEPQLDRFLEQMEFTSDLGNPVFDNFLKKAFKKIKKVAKSGVKAIKKGVKAGLKVVNKLNPLRLILNKLKKLARPLLKRVIKFGLSKVPAQFRPMARKLARKFMRSLMKREDVSSVDLEVMEFEDRVIQSELLAADGALASMPAEVIGTEFDTLMAGYIIDGEDFELEAATVAYVEGLESEDGPRDIDFEQAREKFIRNISNLEEGEDPTPHIEEFIPAILAGLKVALKLIGRKRVVNFLAKFIAQLIGRYVGKQSAKPLSRALVDAGLKLVNLESPEELEHATGAVLAQMVQETVEGAMQAIPEGNLEDDAVLEVYALDAFENAAARNFPPALLRRALRPSGANGGLWQLMPSGRGRKSYKKFTKTFDIKLSPLAAREIETFGDQTLHEFLAEQMGQQEDGRPVEARLHLYEVLGGANLSAISRGEKGVYGLGGGERTAWMQFHPLTSRAAAILLPGVAGLHSRTHPRFLTSRSRLGLGQRLYYLEIPGAHMARARVANSGLGGVGDVSVEAAPAKATELNITIDFAQKRIKVAHFLSEIVASRIAGDLRAGKSGKTLLVAVHKTLTARLPKLLSATTGKHVTVVREFPTHEQFAANIVPMMRMSEQAISKRITQVMLSELSRAIGNPDSGFLKQFIEAADHPADGVTLAFELSGLDDVFVALKRASTEAARAVANTGADASSGGGTITIQSGFQAG